MERINQELDQMLNLNDNSKYKILIKIKIINLNSFLDRINTKINTTNFMIIRDLFRQSINNRRNSSAPMMRESELKNLKALHEEIAKILSQFNNMSNIQLLHDYPAFKSLNEFIGDSISEQENLRSEMWKLEIFVDHIAKVIQEQEKLCSSINDSSS
jgi:hypothetical protein